MKTLGIVIGAVMLLMAGSLGYFISQGQSSLGSVAQGGEYKYTLYTGSSIASTSLIKTGVGTLGSVIITEDQAGAVTLYDATSTAALDGAAALFDTIAIFESAQAEGVYTFDTSFYNGLVISLDGETFAGNMTVTHR